VPLRFALLLTRRPASSTSATTAGPFSPCMPSSVPIPETYYAQHFERSSVSVRPRIRSHRPRRARARTLAAGGARASWIRPTSITSVWRAGAHTRDADAASARARSRRRKKRRYHAIPAHAQTPGGTDFGGPGGRGGKARSREATAPAYSLVTMAGSSQSARRGHVPSLCHS
jgi:hypothetical protein